MLALLGCTTARPIRSLTQEDPLGLAGGLNLYGFAGGDPVNFSDPFGLAPCKPGDWLCVVRRVGWDILGGLAGFVGGAGTGGAEGLACGPGAPFCSSGLALAQGLAG